MSENHANHLNGASWAAKSRGGDLLSLRRDPISHDVSGMILRVSGEVDLSTASPLDEELTALEQELPPHGHLVLDLTEVTFLASAGLSVLIKHGQRCRDAGRDLRIASGNRTVARALLITGLTENLDVFDTLDSALETIG